MTAPVLAQRATGIDVSAWQGENINWATVAKPTSQGGGGIQFAFIRATRGGTTGEYNQSTRVGTLSHRYDDPTTARNVAEAKKYGVLPGVYHFARPDIATNTGVDEANHFHEMAGQYMKPGHLRPVLDLEAGDTRSTADLTNWALAFSDRLFALSGVRPIVYTSTYYAGQVDARINAHDLWLARYTLYDDGTDPRPTAAEAAAAAIEAQTIAPPTPPNYAHPYGVWQTPANPTPWDFWQYTNAGRTPGIGGYVDQNVANGGIEFVKDFLVPAVWAVNADGAWTTTANWNSGTYLPAANDRVIINRSAGDYRVTLASGSQSIRSLQLNERLLMTGGSLNVAKSATFDADVTLALGTITSPAIVNNANFVQQGGTLTTSSITGTGTIAASGGTLQVGSLNQGALALGDGTVRLTSTAGAVIRSLSVTAGTGTLDIANASLVIDYATTSPVDAVREALSAGRILSSAATARTRVGYGEWTAIAEGSSVGGIMPDSTSLVLRLALAGDSNLNGQVNFDDLLALAQRYGGTGHWLDGDANYDGSVDFDDLLTLAQNYGSSMLGSGAITPALATGDFAGDWALAQSLVPEPASVASILAAALLLRRRSRA